MMTTSPQNHRMVRLQILYFVLLATLLGVLLPTLAAAQLPKPLPDLDWAVQMHSNRRSTAVGTGTDSNGNIYMAGSFEYSADFDPNTPGYELHASGRNAAYVVKLDAGGQFQWAKEFDGSSREDVTAIAVDADGNSYTVGTFLGNPDWDPDPSSTYYTGNASNIDMFIVKLNAAGEFQWAHKFGSFGDDRYLGIALDPNGDIYTTGWFQSTVDFDPDPLVTQNRSSTIPAGCAPPRGCSSSPFVQKLNSDGTLAWVEKLETVGRGSDIEVDAGGNSYVVGSHSRVPLDLGIVSIGTDMTGFAVKLDPNGAPIWGAPVSEIVAGGVTHKDLEIDDAGNVYLAGTLSGSTDMDVSPGVDLVASAGNHDFFVQKLNAADGSLAWYRRAGSASGAEVPYGLGVDGAGNVFMGGSFAYRFGGTVDFDPDPVDTYELTAPGNSADFVVWHLDSQGNFGWIYSGEIVPGTYVIPESVEFDSQGALYVAGYFSGGTADFDPDPTDTELFTSSPGIDIPADDFFIQKFGGVAEGGGGSSSTVASWGLDEGTGTTIGDDSGNGLNGTLYGGQWVDGQNGGSALLFDGVDDYVEIPDGPGSAFDITDQLTIALWVKPESLSSIQSLISKDLAYEFELGWSGDDDQYGVRLNNGVAGGGFAGHGSTRLQTHVWQHLAVVWDGATLSFYYNGNLDGTASYAGPLPTNDNPVGIGARPTGFGPQYPFNGRIDTVAIFNEALSSGDIAALAADYSDITPPTRQNGAPVHAVPGGSTSTTLSIDTTEDATCRYSETAGTDWGSMTPFDTTGGQSHSTTVTGLSDGQIFDYFVRCQDTLCNTNPDDYEIIFAVDDIDLTDGLLGAWRFDENSGCTAGDAHGSNHGTLGPSCPANAPTWDTGQEGSALTFDGIDDQVEVANSASLSSYSSISVAAWIKHGDVTSSWRAIVDQRTTGTNGWSFYIDALGRLYMRVNGQTHVGTTLIDDDQWHHVVGTYDGNVIRLYVDSQLEVSKTVGSQTVNVGADLLIGHRFTSNSSTFNGTLDEVMLYDRALSETDIWELFLESP